MDIKFKDILVVHCYSFDLCEEGNCILEMYILVKTEHGGEVVSTPTLYSGGPVFDPRGQLS